MQLKGTHCEASDSVAPLVAIGDLPVHLEEQGRERTSRTDILLEYAQNFPFPRPLGEGHRGHRVVLGHKSTAQSRSKVEKVEWACQFREQEAPEDVDDERGIQSTRDFSVPCHLGNRSGGLSHSLTQAA